MPAGRVKEIKMPIPLLGGDGGKNVKKKGRWTFLRTNPLVPEHISTPEREEPIPEHAGDHLPARKV